MNDDHGLRQPETKAIMSWMEGIHFTASASLHGVISNTLSLMPYYSVCIPFIMQMLHVTPFYFWLQSF